MSKAISPSEVSSHNTVEKGLYIIVDSNVYDMTGFVDEHPGGPKILKRVGGKDASKQFWKVLVPLLDSARLLWQCEFKRLIGIVPQRKCSEKIPGEASDWPCRGEGEIVTGILNREPTLNSSSSRMGISKLYDYWEARMQYRQSR